MDQSKIDHQELAQQLLAQVKADGVELVGPNGLLNQLNATVLESALEAEMNEHLGCEKHQVAGRNSGNSYNGRRTKTVPRYRPRSRSEVPRATDASFDPQIVKKRQRRLTGVDEINLSLSAKGPDHRGNRRSFRRRLRCDDTERNDQRDNRQAPRGNGRIGSRAHSARAARPGPVRPGPPRRGGVGMERGSGITPGPFLSPPEPDVRVVPASGSPQAPLDGCAPHLTLGQGDGRAASPGDGIGWECRPVPSNTCA